MSEIDIESRIEGAKPMKIMLKFGSGLIFLARAYIYKATRAEPRRA